MGKARNWTAEEIEYLKENWGNKSMKAICRRLDRSENAINVMVFKLGLGAARINHSEYITLNSLVSALHGCRATNGHSYEYYTLFKSLPVRMIPQPTVKRRCVKLSDFWKFAEQNRAMFNFGDLEKYSLGPEPEWVEEQRRLDQRTAIRIRTPETLWTPEEDSLLKSLASHKRYTCDELARMFNRSEGAIVRRLSDFGMYKTLKKNKQKAHPQEELDRIADFIRRGYSYTLISQETGRSEKSIRGVVYQRLGTESLLKARAMLLDGAELKVMVHRPRKKKDNE